jgi:hypothetical protein
VAGLLLEVGHYGATGLGVPLVLLAVPGWAVLWRRSPAILLLVTGPLALAWTAGLARVYPLGDRLLMFAVPCLWLPAAAGAGILVRLCRELAARGCARHAAAAWLTLAGGALLPGALRMTKEVFTGPCMPQFREAFDLVHSRRIEGDSLWVSHPQVYEVYRGRPHWLVGSGTPLATVARAARHGRLWMIYNRQGPGLATFPAVFATLKAYGSKPIEAHTLDGLEVVLYAPSGTDSAPTTLPCP